MYRIYFGFLVAIFCSGLTVFANTIENPPNAYLIDHRGVPQFDESGNENQPNHREIGEAVNTQLILGKRRSESCDFLIGSEQFLAN